MAQTDPATPLTIDIVSDVMCPWCYIGKRRMETALTKLNGEIPLDIRWRPYQLDPTLTKQGKDRKKYLEEKFGGNEGATRAYQAVRAAGAEENIAFDFDAIAVSANTLDAHRLIRWAGSQGTDVQDRVVEILFRAYFEQGLNIGDDDVLVEAGTQAGLAPDVIRRLLKDGADIQAVESEIEVSRRMGVTGVPCFILAGKYAVVGAQSPETIEQAIRETYAKLESEAGDASASES